MRALTIACLALVVAAPVHAQFSSDFPGVPRGRVSFLSSTQGRFELDMTGYRLQGETADTLAGSVRMGFGKSWRVGSSLEIGYDFSLGEVRLNKVDAAAEGRVAPPLEVDATLAYGARIGVKYQVFNVVDPDGYGLSASLGAAYQPEVKPVFAHSKRDTISLSGGYLGDSPENGGMETTIASSMMFMGAVSYRMDRIEADAALVLESGADEDTPSFLDKYDGASIAFGGRYRLTSGFGLGISYWGGGAPPWRDRLPLGLRTKDASNFGLLLSFGTQLEKATDVMISSPTGSFKESVSLYVRVH